MAEVAEKPLADEPDSADNVVETDSGLASEVNAGMAAPPARPLCCGEERMGV